LVAPVAAAFEVGPFHFSYTYMDRVAGSPISLAGSTSNEPAFRADEGFLPIGFSDGGLFAWFTAGVSAASGRYGVALHLIHAENPRFYEWHPFDAPATEDGSRRTQLARAAIEANREEIAALLDRHRIDHAEPLSLSPLPMRTRPGRYHAKIVDPRYGGAPPAPGVPPVFDAYTVELRREAGGTTVVASSRIAAQGVLNVSVMGIVVSPDERYGALVIAEESLSFAGEESLFRVRTVGTSLK
jgi:hypothetical protein